MKKINIVLVICWIMSASVFTEGCSDAKDEELELSEFSGYGGDDEESACGGGEKALEIAGLPGENAFSEEVKKETVMVYVCGQVENAGVYELDEGARIVDALIAAGGFTESAMGKNINQAELLTDGAMIYVPSVDEAESELFEAPQGGTASPKTGEQSGGPVNINLADKSQLMTITGVGEAKAEKIIAYREQSGSFKSIEDIMNVPGIKEGMFQKIKDQICVK
ncbi:MAG: ComEA family DNA-binding protein [Lachnospiraceae bacterium]|nr:ComEA family DNA-binding protein [Lachnospiraceae bacterium]